MERYRRALTRSEAATSPDADDPRLRGRTYAVPFETVWQAMLALAKGDLKGWRLVAADGQRGHIRAEADALFGRAVVEVEIRIGLDANAQTRVDADAVVRARKRDFGASTRTLAAFFAALDDTLARDRGRRPDQPTPMATPAG